MQTLSLEDLVTKLNDPTWVFPYITLAIESIEHYAWLLLPRRWGIGPKLSGTTKARMAAGMSISAPVAGNLLPVFSGHFMEWWQIIAVLLSGVANFLFSTKFHDLLSGQLGSGETQANTTSNKKGAK